MFYTEQPPRLDSITFWHPKGPQLQRSPLVVLRKGHCQTIFRDRQALRLTAFDHTCMCTFSLLTAPPTTVLIAQRLQPLLFVKDISVCD